MRINITQKIQDYDGKDIPLSVEDSTPLTIKDIFFTALNNPGKDEMLTAEDKNKAFQLCVKMTQQNEVDFTVDDLSFIKERVNKIWTSPLICGKVNELIEGPREEETPKA